MSMCNYCRLKQIKRDHPACKILVRPSDFMNGVDVFVVPKGEKLPNKREMVQPCKIYPNGNEAYSKYHVAWLAELPNRCEC